MKNITEKIADGLLDSTDWLVEIEPQVILKADTHHTAFGVVKQLVEFAAPVIEQELQRKGKWRSARSGVLGAMMGAGIVYLVMKRQMVQFAEEYLEESAKTVAQS